MLVKTAKRSYGKMSNDMAVLLTVLPVGYGSRFQHLIFLELAAPSVLLPTTYLRVPTYVRVVCYYYCVSVNSIE